MKTASYFLFGLVNFLAAHCLAGGSKTAPKGVGAVPTVVAPMRAQALLEVPSANPLRSPQTLVPGEATAPAAAASAQTGALAGLEMSAKTLEASARAGDVGGVSALIGAIYGEGVASVVGAEALDLQAKQIYAANAGALKDRQLSPDALGKIYASMASLAVRKEYMPRGYNVVGVLASRRQGAHGLFDALGYFKMAVKLEPGNALFHFNLALLRWATGEDPMGPVYLYEAVRLGLPDLPFSKELKPILLAYIGNNTLSHIDHAARSRFAGLYNSGRIYPVAQADAPTSSIIKPEDVEPFSEAMEAIKAFFAAPVGPDEERKIAARIVLNMIEKGPPVREHSLDRIGETRRF